MTTAATEIERRDARGDGVILSVRRLGRRFGSRAVVSNLNLDLRPGERVALWGPNGSGKTTVLRCLAGTLTLSTGSAMVDGHRVGTLAARRLTGVSLSQERAFYMRLSGRENLLFFAGARGFGLSLARRLVRRLEDELELSAVLEQRADRCSSGMLQQLALARAFLGDPKLLLLDEPTRSLDAAARERLWHAIDRRSDAAVVIATHQQEDLDRCHERIILPV